MVFQLLSRYVEVEGIMMVAAGLAVLVVFCLLLSVLQTPPHIGR